MAYKKKSVVILLAALFICADLIALSFKEDSSVTSVDTLLIETFTPDYSYEYVPDVPYDLIEDRIACLDTDITLSYNFRVKSFIDYFTIRDRAYTKMKIQ